MIKHLFPLVFLLSVSCPTVSMAQFADFESFGLPVDTFLNGSDQSRGFLDSSIYFPNLYDTNFGGYWADGFAISTMRDDTTEGFMNLYSSIAGGGYNSPAYAVVNAVDTVSLWMNGPFTFENGYQWTGLRISNSTYAYYSMLNGDNVGKVFGGSSGDDPDYFFIRIYVGNGGLQNDSLDFYLADFRDANSAHDYILQDWKYVDLTALEPNNPTLSFKLFSSDKSVINGDTSINTPLFFCIDEVAYSTSLGANVYESATQGLTVFPNPAIEKVHFYHQNAAFIILSEVSGRKIKAFRSSGGQGSVDVSDLKPGLYILRVQDENGNAQQAKFLKQ